MTGEDWGRVRLREGGESEEGDGGWGVRVGRGDGGPSRRRRDVEAVCCVLAGINWRLAVIRLLLAAITLLVAVR